MAVNISTSDLCCLNLQLALDSIAGENTPDSIKETFGMWNALKSGVNTNGFQAIPINSFPGKQTPQTGPNAANRPRFEVKYIKPRRDTAATSKVGLCGATTASTDPYGYMDVTVANVRALEGTFSKSDFAALCETPQERLAVDIRHTALDIMRALNDKLITDAYALCGLYADATASVGATAKSVPLLNGAGHVNPAAMAAVKSQFRRQQTSTPPILVGGDILGVWTDTRMMAGVGNTQLASANTAAVLGGANVFVDFQTDPVIQAIETDTDSHAVSWIPGAFQVLEWYDYLGYNAELGKEDYTETQITVDGVTFDFSLSYDACTHTWKYELSKYFDLWAIPDAAYTQGSSVWNFNRRLHFKLACGDFTCGDYMIGEPQGI